MNPVPTGADRPDFAGLLETPGRITPADVLYFRHEVFRDGVVSRSEADAIFAMNDTVAEKCAEWIDFYVEALAEYVVNEEEPRGYVSTDKAEWLIARVSHDGHIDAASELELLVKVLDRARSSPEALVGFALREVVRAVVDGQGPLACADGRIPRVISEADVELLRRILYAFGGDSGISISRTEADILFDLNERADPNESHPVWRELFVKAVANYLMAVATERPLSRAEALVREEWLDDTGANVDGVLLGALRGFGELLSRSFLDDLLDGAHAQIEKAWAERNARMEAAMASAERIDDIEAEWLIDKLCGDGVIDSNERGLLDFIRRESPHVSATLQPLMDKVAAGA